MQPLPVREKWAEEYARGAITSLKQAANVGLFRDPFWIQNLDRLVDFAILRDREDYKRFRSKLKMVKR